MPNHGPQAIIILYVSKNYGNYISKIRGHSILDIALTAQTSLMEDTWETRREDIYKL